MFAKASEEHVFRYVYKRLRTSKQNIARDLNLSLPTVSHALAALEDEGLVVKRGTFPSSGGRPAKAYELCANARYAIGVELAADSARVALVDLVGNIVTQSVLWTAFSRTEAYLKNVVDHLEAEIRKSGLPHDRLLGITFAIQGIVSRDERVTFGELLGEGGTDISLQDFSQYIRYPLHLVHDAEAAAHAEIWRHRDLKDFVYLSLNDHLGSALVKNRRLMRSNGFGAGVAEHMTAIPLGMQCYCGNHGCFETVLGAKALERQAGTTVQRFFERLQHLDSDALLLWDRYLDNLALLIHNLRMIACGDVMIGGRLSRYLTQRDLRTLRLKLNNKGVLSRYDYHLLCGHYRDSATALGAGIMVINGYLDGFLDGHFAT